MSDITMGNFMQYVVSEFEFLQDQLSVVDYLLPQDLEKILP